MKNLLKFSVTWRRVDDRHLILKLVEADSIESRVKPEEETLEAFAEGLETLSFVLEEKDSELRRGEVVTLEFVGNDLKYIYIRGKQFLIVRCNEAELYLLKPVQTVKGIEHLPEVFQHRIKMLAEYAGPDFLSWDLQQEIQGCELAAAVYNRIIVSDHLLTEADFANLGKLLGEDYKFVGSVPANFALAMAFALESCLPGLLQATGKELVKKLATCAVMYLPICGDTAGMHYCPNRQDVLSYVKTQSF